MRCLTLAEALRVKGANCRFVCREHHGEMTELIRQREFEVHVLPAQKFSTKSGLQEEGVVEKELTHAAWLGADWATDAEQTINGIGESTVDWLIIDHYAIDIRWEQQLRSACRKLMVIDDLADRKHDCDLLLDQNLGRDATDYVDLITENCTVLVGPKYALLRPEFAELRDNSITRRATPQLKRLLITMGGVDNDNATGKVLEALQGSALPTDCRITVVMGLHAPCLAQVRDMAAKLPWEAEVLMNVQDMGKLMADSDLAIGAAGTSAWERCCLGLPTLTMVLAANQQNGATALKDIGAVLLLENQEQGQDQLATELHEKISLLLDTKRLQAIQQVCASVTNGNSVSQIATILTNANRVTHANA